MQVKATDRLSAPLRTRGRNRLATGDAAFEIDQETSPERTATLARPAASSGVDMLMSLQGVQPFADDRQKALDESHHMLDILDELKVGLLAGQIPGERIARLQRAVDRFGMPSGDPRLREILEAIDLRARVELAKLQRNRR